VSRDWKTPVNWRGTPSPVMAEPFEIVGGVALIAEAPADPANPAYPITVTVGGNPRTRVTGAVHAGEYKILSQTVIGADGNPHLEYLPVLQFNATDNGLSGAATYYRSGTVLTEQFFDLLRWFLTPITGVADLSALTSLYPPTSDVTKRGRPGDMAITTGRALYVSDGTTWFSAGVEQANLAAVTAAAAMGVSSSSGFAAAWSVARSQAAAFGFAATEEYVASGLVGALTAATQMGISAVSGFSASWTDGQAPTAAIGFACSSDYTPGGGGGLSVSDDFNRATLADGTHPWAAPSGFTAPSLSGNCVVGAAGASRAAYWDAECPDNQFAEVKIISGPWGTGEPAGVCVRMSAAGAGYWATVTATDLGDEQQFDVQLRKLDGTILESAPLALGTGQDISEVAEMLRVEASGTTLTVKVKPPGGSYTTKITSTDATYASGKIGMRLNGAYTFDDFAGGSLP
jgi:hypothetical protein